MIGIAGTLESNDCIITIKDSDKLSITIESIVYDYFKDQIEAVILETLKEYKLDKVNVLCQDKGALDFTIKARLITAIERMR